MKVSIRELGAYLAFLFAPLMTPLWAGDIDHFIPPGVSFTRNTVLEGHVFAGTNDGWIGAPDFLLEAGICVPSGAIHPNCDGTPKLHVRGLLTRDVNDSPDLAVGRAEFRDPNGMACTPPHDGPTNCLPIDLPTGTPIGGWVWQAYGRRTDGSFGWWTYDPPAANYGQGRIAHIYAKTAVETVEADRLAGCVSHEISLRYRPGLQPAMRFRQGTRIFYIVSVINVDERNRWLKCLCEERDL
jgi:hypothetical protein